MARVKISEFQAKELLKQELGLDWQAVSVNSDIKAETIAEAFGARKLVAKVDQGVKQRGRKGLLAISDDPAIIVKFIRDKGREGYRQFIIEPFIEHLPDEEQYLSLERVREGIKVLYAERGGVDVEDNWDLVGSHISRSEVREFTDRLMTVFDKYHLSFLEINPLVTNKSGLHILDLAVEMDDAALNLPEVSAKGLVPVTERDVHPAEKAVRELDGNTPASLKFRVMDPDGSIWMLLSGGGASLVLADEIADLGRGRDLGNYGEYSGNPTTEDTYLYTRTVLQTMLRSKARKKLLIIAGGVANFTDVKKTFAGVIKALDEFKTDLKKQRIKVFVRRGGPNQEQGLKLMASFLRTAGLYGAVMGPDRELTDVVKVALKGLKDNPDA